MKPASQKKKLTPEEWWRDIVEYERTHPIAFASPSALAEARVIAELEKARRRRRPARRNGTGRPRKTAAG